jgi:hypothetical protein
MAPVVFITILALLIWFEFGLGLGFRVHHGFPPLFAADNLDTIQTGFSETGLAELKRDFHSKDHRILLRQVTNSVFKVESQPSKNPLIIYQEARNGKGALCDGMSLLYFSVLRLNGIRARMIYLTRNIYDIYDTHTTVEVFWNGKWAIYDPTFNISFERDGILLSAQEIHEALLNDDFNTIKPVFYGEANYPARIQNYYIHWLPLFNNVFVIGDRKSSIWERIPPFRYWYGDAYYYQESVPYSDYHLQFYNGLVFLVLVIIPVAIYGAAFCFTWSMFITFKQKLSKKECNPPIR